MDQMTIEPPKSAKPSPKGSARDSLPRRQPKRSRWWMVWVALVLLVIVVCVGWGWHHHQATVLAAQTPTETAIVKRATIEKHVESAGSIDSNLDVDIKCRASGPVAKLPVDISTTVKAGDLLCQLDPTDQQLAERVAERTVTQSTARLEQAKLTYQQAELNLQTVTGRAKAALDSAQVKAANLQAKAERQKQLKDQKLGSEEDYESAQTEAAVAKADAESAQEAVNELKQQEIQLSSKKLDVANAASQLEADKFNLDQQKQQLEYTTVLSPMDGTVAELSVQIGSMVQSGVGGFSGGTTIMTLSDLSHMFAIATVDQSDIGGVQVGQDARVEVDSFPNHKFTGKVVRIATEGQNTSNVVTFKVKVEVTDKDKNLLRPQMTGTVTIIEEQRKDVLVVPTAAVAHRNGKTSVKLAGGVERPVILGLEGSEGVEVTSGLSEGDKVIVEQTELPTRWKNDGPPK